MAKKPDGDMRPFGHSLPQEVIDEFNQFCDRVGVVKWKGLRAAIGLLARVPSEVQFSAIRGEWQEVENWMQQRSSQKGKK